MSRALYEDIYLDETQIQRVRDYLGHTGFELPGASLDDLEINPRARYLGYMFQQEDLESYGVGLSCTKPGMTHLNTFIRMSRGQLLGHDDARVLPVNQPVIARDALTLNRYYEREDENLRHGVDTYSGDDGAPGADMDMDMLEGQLADIMAFHHGEPVPGNQETLDLKVFWGTLLAGRYARLSHLQSKGVLSTQQSARFEKLTSSINSVAEILRALGLPTLQDL